jgi:hypothetical protein
MVTFHRTDARDSIRAQCASTIDAPESSDAEHGRMKLKIIFVTLTLLFVAAAALPQMRITSFGSDGALTWTNFAILGAYSLQWADRPTGPWQAFDTLTNLNSIWVATNYVTVFAPVTNARAFYRVVWIPPDPVGVWDYHGYDFQGNLLITGQLSMPLTTVLATNPPILGVQGSWDLQYAGPPTTNLWYLRPQIGTGWFTGTLGVGYPHLHIMWPTNIIDDTVELIGTIWPNSYTGTWNYVTLAGPQAGPFSARRR